MPETNLVLQGAADRARRPSTNLAVHAQPEVPTLVDLGHLHREASRHLPDCVALKDGVQATSTTLVCFDRIGRYRITVVANGLVVATHDRGVLDAHARAATEELRAADPVGFALLHTGDLPLGAVRVDLDEIVAIASCLPSCRAAIVAGEVARIEIEPAIVVETNLAPAAAAPAAPPCRHAFRINRRGHVRFDGRASSCRHPDFARHTALAETLIAGLAAEGGGPMGALFSSAVLAGPLSPAGARW